MKLLIPILSILGATLVFFACRGGRGGFSGPLPPDFELRYWEDGGMVPTGKNYTIGRDSVLVETWYLGNRNQWRFSVSETQLDSLWQVIRQHKANRIQTYEEMVYDRGGNGFSFTANGEQFEVKNSGMNFVEGAYVADFKAIVESIHQAVNPGLKNFVVDYQVELAGEMPDSVSQFFLSLNDASLLDWSSASQDSFPYGMHNFKMLAGQYQLQAWAQINSKNQSVEMPIALEAGQTNSFQVAWRDGSWVINNQE
jgi:hypothetical protein